MGYVSDTRIIGGMHGLATYDPSELSGPEVGIDWLSLTADQMGPLYRLWDLHKGEYRALYPGAKVETAIKGQYTGRQLGSGFIGERKDGKAMLIFTGALPNCLYDVMLPDTVRITRLDLQMTVAALRNGDAYGSVLHNYLHDLQDRGLLDSRLKLLAYVVRGMVQTQYIGAPTSERRIRVYNKSEQLGDALGEAVLWRHECQLRRERAAEAWQLIKASPNTTQGIARVIAGMLSRIHILIDVEGGPLRPRRQPYKGESTHEAKMAWIRDQVLPTLRKLAASAEHGDELAALLGDIGMGPLGDTIGRQAGLD